MLELVCFSVWNWSNIFKKDFAYAWIELPIVSSWFLEVNPLFDLALLLPLSAFETCCIESFLGLNLPSLQVEFFSGFPPLRIEFHFHLPIVCFLCRMLFCFGIGSLYDYLFRRCGWIYAFILRSKNLPTSDRMIFSAMRVSAAGSTFWPSAVAEERLLPTSDVKALQCPIFLTRAIKYIYGDGVLFFYCYFLRRTVAIELSFS